MTTVKGDTAHKTLWRCVVRTWVRLPLAVVVFLVWSALVLAAAAVPDWRTWAGQDPSAAAFEHVLGEAARFLATLPKEAKANTPDALLRAVVERRIGLVTELQELFARSARLSELLRQQAGLEAAQKQALQQLQAAGPVGVDAPVTVDLVRRREEEAKSERQTVEQLRRDISAASTRADELSKRLGDLQERKQTALERAERLERESAAADGVDKERQAWSLANARLDARVAEETVAVLRAETAADARLGQYRSLALDVAQQRLEATERQLALERDALELRLEQEGKALEEALATKLAEAEAAGDPIQRFVVQWELRIARVKNNLSDVEPFQISLGRDIEDQEKRLEADKHELRTLKDQVTRFGTGGRVAANIRRAYRHLDTTRKAVKLAIKPGVVQSLDEFRDRRFVIDDTLFGLKEQWQTELDALPEPGRRTVRAASIRLRDEYRQLLNKEKSVLTEVISQGDRLQGVQTERMFAVEELSAFVRARIFWIRDVEPLDEQTVSTTAAEVRRFWNWTLGRLIPGVPASVGDVVRRPLDVGYLLLGLVALPLLIIAVRSRLRNAISTWRMPPAAPRAFWKALLVWLAAMVETGLLPLYILFLGWAVTRLALDADIGVPVGRLVMYLAVFSLVLSFSRTFVRPGGLWNSRTGVYAESTNRLYGAIKAIALAFAVFFIPYAVLAGEPFGYQFLPQFALTAFMVVLAGAMYRLFELGSPVIRDVFGSALPARLPQWQSAWNGLLLAALFAVPVLNLAGFRFSALSLGRSLLLSLGTALVLPWLYRACLPLADRFQRHFAHSVAQPPGQETIAVPATAQGGEPTQARRLLRGAFIIFGLYLFAAYWGLNIQAWHAVDAMQIYKVSGQGDMAEYVSVADVLTAIAIMLVTSWLLRHLPGIYDLAIFMRMEVDIGLRYAIVTISRYGLFFVGFMFALSAIKLDLSRIGWLIAAMGVGLGFGLQEIVSNFVCGIILLVERPIRVGDLVTVGSVTGRVQRINIRATTIVNFDRQEVVVPNRSLITSEVTNWTLVDNITRLVVPIGVAYGSDIDKVREILEAIVRHQPEALKDPAPQVIFLKHGESSLDFELRIFLGDPSLRMILLDRINAELNRDLARHGIEIPFPQRDLHIKSTTVMPVPVENSELPTDPASARLQTGG